MARRQRLDRDLRNYLVSGERVVTAVRQHWAALTLPATAFVAATVFAFWVDINAPATAGGRALANAGWLLWLVALAWAGWRLLNWRRDWFVATDKRMLLFYGFIRRRVAMMPLTKVTDMTFERSIPGRILGYGAFVLESAGHDQALSHIEYVPDADHHYREICAVLFGTEDAEDVQDGWDDGWEGWDDGDDDGWDDDSSGPYAGGPSPIEHARPRGRRPRGIPGRGSSGRRPATRAEDDWGSPVTDHYPPDPPRPRAESIYRSPDRERAFREADTGEIPVVPPREQWYVPHNWRL